MSKPIRQCIKSWDTHLEGWQRILWNEENSPLDHPFVKNAQEDQNYAFMSDYTRLWALYRHGGVYLDTDMLVLKHMDDLTENGFFIGKQDDGLVNGSIIGSPPGHPFLKLCLEEYDQLGFDHLERSNMAIPLVLSRALLKYNGPQIRIFEKEYFYPYPFSARTAGDMNYWKFITDKSYTVHLWDASWIPDFNRVMGNVSPNKSGYLKKIVQDRFIKIINSISGNQ